MGNALSSKNAYITIKRGVRNIYQSTIGWKFLCEFKDGSNRWVSLKVLKESHPIEVAEYVTVLNLETAPALTWWVPYAIKKRDRIIASINWRVTNQDHKFGIKIPKDIKEALKLDQDNGKTLWQDSYKKEMFQVGVAFKILRDGEHIPVGYNKSSGHSIWLVNMDFTRKARWVKYDHRTPDLEDSKYAGVVSR